MKNFEDQINFSGRDLSPSVTKLLHDLDLTQRQKATPFNLVSWVGYEGEGSSEVAYYFARRVSFESEKKKKLTKFYNPW